MLRFLIEMSDHGRRILLVSYFFPPAGGVSVQRMLSLAKYLPREDCDVGVLTALNGVYPVSDPALLTQVPACVKIHRVFTPEPPYALRRRVWERLNSTPAAGAQARVQDGQPSHGHLRGLGRLSQTAKRMIREPVRRVLLPDPQVLWTPFAIYTASRVIRDEGYDTVVVTAPPYSSFIIGNALKERFPHLQLVSDFRDDWFGFYLGGVDSMASEHKRRHAIALERETVHRSDRVVLVTDGLREDVRARYPDQPAEKFVVVPNGYDPTLQAPLAPKPVGGTKMVVTYLGTVYTPCSPRHFLDALDSLPERIRDNIEVRFVGRVVDSEKPFLEGRRGQVRAHGFLPQQQAIRHLEEADYLLLIVDDPLTLSGKLFEYLATGRPILALTPRAGESARLVKRARAGRVAEPRDVPAITRLLADAYERFRAAQHTVEPDWSLVRRYERPRLAAEYLRVLRTAPA